MTDSNMAPPSQSLRVQMHILSFGSNQQNMVDKVAGVYEAAHPCLDYRQ